MAKTIRNVNKRGHQVVEILPISPKPNASYWIESPNGKREYTHSLFKFPAKFHPPIVRWAIKAYYESGEILDPFSGSGTVQVEALAQGISSIGIDIDPLSVYISEVKSTPIEPQRLKKEFIQLKKTLSKYESLHAEQERMPGGDISEDLYKAQGNNLPIPPISNIAHWFRLYVIIDLARLLKSIDATNMRVKSRKFFKACLAAIIRRVSNAEPDTVSGLEVTKIQAEKNKIRKISVFKTFYMKAESEIQNMEDLWNTYKEYGNSASATIICGDATKILKKRKKLFQHVSLVITSPPYCRAVEYSDRHHLEVYWLQLIDNEEARLSLARSYTGRKRVRSVDWDKEIDFKIPALNKTIKKIEQVERPRGRAVRHYFYSMEKFFHELFNAVPNQTNVVCVLGNSVSGDIPIDTAHFVAALASRYFTLKKQFSYVIRHHHMKHGLWNGSGIKREYVLVLQKKTANKKAK